MFQALLTERGLDNFNLECKQAKPRQPILNPLVHSFLQIKSSAPTPYPIAPDGSCALFISSNNTFIGGAHTSARVLFLPSAGEYFGIRFFPGAIRHWGSVNLKELKSKYSDDYDCLSRDLLSVHRRLSSLATFEARAKACEILLLETLCLKSHSRLDVAVEFINQNAGCLRVEAIASYVNCSARHLNRLFLESIGLSIKAYAQVVRFQRACNRLYQPNASVIDVALSSGYFDQAHLCKDLRKRMGHKASRFYSDFMSDFYKPA